MTFKQFDSLTQDMLSKVIQMRDTKGKEYANSEIDRLANFKDIAAELSVSPLVVWSIYFKKHIRAIDNFVKRGTGEVLSESIEGRFVDAITYLLLGYGLVVDQQELEKEQAFKRMEERVVSDRCGHVSKHYPDKKCILISGHLGSHRSR